MSAAAEDLSEVIRVAVDEWLATHGGGMTTAYEMAVNYYNADGEQCWASAHGDGQSAAHTLGLLRWHTMAVEHDIARYLSGGDE